jgi:prepilin-type N-terminal cleavage/methylation domain-containing protein
MNKFFRKNRHGVTLIELVIAIAIMAVVGITTLSILLFGSNTLKASDKEVEFQFSTRMIFNETSNIIRYSSAVFTIPASSFRADNLCAGWDYIGIHEVVITPAQNGNPAVMGYEIVKYVYDKTTNTHMPYVLMDAKPDVFYEFVFEKTNPQDVDSLLKFTIKTYPAGSLDEYGRPRAQLTVKSEVEARNSLQVIDLASLLDPAFAIAFRHQDRAKNVVGHIAMVMDKSGSMADNMAGQPNRVPSRISILKNEATSLIHSFAQEDNIDISLIPFSTSANNPNAFINSRTGESSLVSIVNSFTALGGTNTGDGLRRAYWGLKAHNAEVPSDIRVRNYIIVLVDGVTTFASVISNSNRNFYTADGNVREGYLDRTDPRDTTGQIAGNGSDLDAKGTAYVNAIGALLRADEFAKTYVIGFSSLSSELESVNDIAEACGAPSERVFRADSQTALAEVFETIREDIVNDLWYLQGPDL